METTAEDLLAAWRSAEAAALTGLGWTRDIPDVYETELTGDGRWAGRVYLPKNTRGGVVHQAYPAPGVIHRPTEELLVRLEAYEPGTAPPPETVGALLNQVVPPPETMRYSRITVRRATDIPGAVDRTVELVRDRLLPWLHQQADLDVVHDHLAGPPYPRNLRYPNLRRLVVFEHLRGDDAGARAALDTYLTEYPGSPAPEVQARHDAFVAAARELLRAPR